MTLYDVDMETTGAFVVIDKGHTRAIERFRQGLDVYKVNGFCALFSKSARHRIVTTTALTRTTTFTSRLAKRLHWLFSSRQAILSSGIPPLRIKTCNPSPSGQTSVVTSCARWSCSSPWHLPTTSTSRTRRASFRHKSPSPPVPRLLQSTR